MYKVKYLEKVWLPSVAPSRKPGSLWVEGRALELDFFFDPSHLFVRLLFIGSPWLWVSTSYRYSLLCTPSSAKLVNMIMKGNNENVI